MAEGSPTIALDHCIIRTILFIFYYFISCRPSAKTQLARINAQCEGQERRDCTRLQLFYVFDSMSMSVVIITILFFVI